MTMTHAHMTRRILVQKSLVGATLGAAALALPVAGYADTTEDGPDSVQVLEILQLQAAFHRAKSRQDIDLMMSLWAPDATFNNVGTLLTGTAEIRAFFQTSGSFTHHRISFVPSFKDQVSVHGNQAFLYFECHDADLETGALVAHLFLAGTVRNRNGRWVFQDMTGGLAPLSIDQIYFA
jgi:ketosteroid isomerase-like protein